MNLAKLLERLGMAEAADDGERLHRRSPCPECGDEGPHDDNGLPGQRQAFCCQECGLHFDAYPAG